MADQNKALTNFETLAPKESLKKTVAALQNKNFKLIQVGTKAEALAKIKTLIPDGASVMNGASVTLEQIGYLKYLRSGRHPWDDLHAKITAENNDAKRHKLRRQSVLSDYYLGSVHALTEDGQLVIASNTGSQLPHIVFTSPNLIFVVSTKKIVSDLDEAMRRVEEHTTPLEDKRLMEAMNSHTQLNKIVILKNDPDFLGRKIYIILVEENLGF